jgi:hypothetical protein
MIAIKLWSDDHNYIPFIIKIDSLVKLGVAISTFFTVFTLSLLLSIFHDKFHESHFSNQSDGEHQVWIRGGSACSATTGSKQQ